MRKFLLGSILVLAACSASMSTEDAGVDAGGADGSTSTGEDASSDQTSVGDSAIVDSGADTSVASDAGVDASDASDAPVDAADPADAADASDPADAADAADAHVPPAGGSHVWSKIFGEATTNLGRIRVATGPNGQAFVIGNFTGTIDLGGGPLVSPAGVSACYIAGFDAGGAHLWSKSFAAVNCRNIASDASGIYLAGEFSASVSFGGSTFAVSGPSANNMFMAKLSHAGGHLWSRRFVSEWASFNRIAILGSDIVLLGERITAGSVSFGGGTLTGPTGNFLVRLKGSSGAHVWSRQSTGIGNGDLNLALTTDPAGNIVIARGLFGTADWGGGPLTAVGEYDVLVVKFSGAGNLLWTKLMSGPTREYAQAVATNAANEIFVAGRVSGNSWIDFGPGQLAPVNPTSLGQYATFLAKLSPNGDGIWQKIFSTDGPTVTSEPYALATDGAGNVIVTGESACGLDFGGGALPATAGRLNIFVAKLDGAGAHLWSKGWASAANGSGTGQDIAADPNGSVVLGAFLRTSTIDMGGGPMTAVSNQRILAKFGP